MYKGKCSKCNGTPIISNGLCVECISKKWGYIVEGEKTKGLSFCGIHPQSKEKVI